MFTSSQGDRSCGRPGVSPCTRVRIGRSPWLAGSQIEFFKEHGYLILEDALWADEVRQLRDASERLQEQRERDGGAENLVAIMNINLFDDAFNQTARHPAIIGAARSLLGDNLRLQHSTGPR